MRRPNVAVGPPALWPTSRSPGRAGAPLFIAKGALTVFFRGIGAPPSVHTMRALFPFCDRNRFLDLLVCATRQVVPTFVFACADRWRIFMCCCCVRPNVHSLTRLWSCSIERLILRLPVRPPLSRTRLFGNRSIPVIAYENSVCYCLFCFIEFLKM
jgi:hypothetical protein